MSNRTTKTSKLNGTSWQRSATAAMAVAAIVGSLLGATGPVDAADSAAPDLSTMTVELSSACWTDVCDGTTVNQVEPIASTDVISIEPITDIEPIADIQPIADIEPIADLQPIADIDPIEIVPEIEVLTPLGRSYNLSTVNTMATYFNNKGWTGEGVDVAVIDSGISPVYGLNSPGQVIYGPDLTSDANTANANLDTYGHGSHIAGIIAGRAGDMTGGAPEARLVSIKVASADGATAVPQIIAAIDWVIANKNKDGLNIRVLNLSFGLDRAGDAGTDPLMAAVNRAWDAGIVVVAAAGNRGYEYGAIDSPAASPKIIAVGSTTPGWDSGVNNEGVSGWSNSGDGIRNPDIVVPGKSLLSARVPGSTLEQLYPSAIDGDMFKGSGTSQSSAVVSGWAAAILSGNPGMTPDQLKAALKMSTVDIETGTHLDGEGRLDPLDLKRPVWYAQRSSNTQHYEQTAWYLDGVLVDSAELTALFSGGSWAGGSWAGGSWAGGSWAGGSWAGGSWAGGSWAGGSWAGGSWAGGSWAGGSWGQN